MRRSAKAMSSSGSLPRNRPPASEAANPSMSVDNSRSARGILSAADADLDLFAKRLIDIASAHGKTEAVDEIRRRFDHERAEQTDEAPDGTAPPQGDEPSP
nr:hypothetical protein OG999_43815 [Streptomyces sp. NBC_00886]